MILCSLQFLLYSKYKTFYQSFSAFLMFKTKVLSKQNEDVKYNVLNDFDLEFGPLRRKQDSFPAYINRYPYWVFFLIGR